MKTLSRDQYGQIIFKYYDDADQKSAIEAIRELIARAANDGAIPAAYDDLSWDKKGRSAGGALHHEIYDISPDLNRALVCIRTTEGGRYGVRTTSKSYCVVARHGRGVRVLPANKAVAAKAAKAAKTAANLGDAILVSLGKMKLPVKPGTVRTGYKLLKRVGTGFASVWDGSAWDLGKTRIEASTDDHTGGFYYYATLEECLAAAANNAVFSESRSHNQLAIVQVEASGNHYVHAAEHGEKLCATRVTPIREIASTL